MDCRQEFRGTNLPTDFRPDVEHGRFIEVNELHSLLLLQVHGKFIRGFRKAFVQLTEIQNKAFPASRIFLLEQPRRSEGIHPVFTAERPAPIKGVRFPFGQTLHCEVQILFRDCEFVAIARSLVSNAFSLDNENGIQRKRAEQLGTEKDERTGSKIPNPNGLRFVFPVLLATAILERRAEDARIGIG